MKEIIKVAFLKYTDEIREILFLLIQEFKDNEKTYELFNLLPPEQVFDMFQRCLGRNTLDTWDEIIMSKTINITNFSKAMLELVETLVGKNTGEEQLINLCETKKLSELNVQA